ncbi:hypothetical protein H8R13_04520 [Morganella morganii]|uniref:hypothetical protein n=1 Tax=Morganella morganii TaxID=582 RepID=UPI00164CBED6|nr:hypothetical protein [Morganella morganii]MBC4011005.1 hypothetical protein [Morganella morganii]
MARMLSVFFTRRPRFAHLNKKTTVHADGGFSLSNQNISLNHFVQSQAASEETRGAYISM